MGRGGVATFGDVLNCSQKGLENKDYYNNVSAFLHTVAIVTKFSWSTSKKIIRTLCLLDCDDDN